MIKRIINIVKVEMDDWYKQDGFLLENGKKKYIQGEIIKSPKGKFVVLSDDGIQVYTIKVIEN